MSSLTHQMYTTPFPASYAASDGTAGSAAAAAAAATAADKPPAPAKEEEVDALTSLLVQSMDNAADPEFFGIFHISFMQMYSCV